jgi:hypothetical protein
MRRRFLLPAVLLILILALAALAAWPLFQQRYRVSAAPAIYASPIQAGCYIAAPNDCRLHVEPFTINLASGAKLVFFQLLADPSDANATVIYDFKPDLSNPVPFSGSTFSPSLVAQDYAAACGKTYSLYLIGRDTLDPNPYVLGGTGEFTCPVAVP